MCARLVESTICVAVQQIDVSQLQAMEAEFNSLAKRMREIHNLFRAQATEDLPVQKRYFFYSGIIEVEMSQDAMDTFDLEPGEITPKFVKDKIEVAIMDETPFVVAESGGYCSEVAGNVESVKVDLRGLDFDLTTAEKQ